MSVLDLIRPELRQLKSYKPGNDDLKHRFQANECPWSPVTMQPIALNHYPNIHDQITLQKQLASYYQVNPEQLVLTRGSDDGINFIMRLFLSPGQNSVLQCPPTFPMYAFYAQLQHAQVINCPLISEEQFTLSLDRLFAAWQPSCKLIFLCQPNNPTGNLLDLTTIATICQQVNHQTIVVVDEAYIEFAPCESATTLLNQHENLIVLRTLSKAFGLAGLRLGCIIAQPALIAALQTTMAPYLIPSPVITLAQQALQKNDWLANCVQEIGVERQRIYTFLQQLFWVEHVYPSHANFILIKTSHAQSLMLWLAEHHIAVRDFNPPLDHLLRITIGDKTQNKWLITVLKRFKITTS